MNVSFYLFHSLPFKISNKGMDFLFLLLKFPNKGMNGYSKIIFFIHFLSLKWEVRGRSLWKALGSKIKETPPDPISLWFEAVFRWEEKAKWDHHHATAASLVKLWNLDFLVILIPPQQEVQCSLSCHLIRERENAVGIQGEIPKLCTTTPSQFYHGYFFNSNGPHRRIQVKVAHTISI